jgi:glycerol-3-phosphate acyltransferase PlsX
MANFAIDLHGGDFGPSVLIPACFRFFRDNPDDQGILVGDLKQFRSLIQHCPANIQWLDRPPLEGFSAKPSSLLRHESHSSIEACFKLVQKKQADALISAEHTGVLLVLTMKYGSIHPHLKRPVLASFIPTKAKPAIMLDLGASYSANKNQLLAFSAIGKGLASNPLPVLKLLNVGVENFKGPIEIQAAHKALTQWDDIDYQGFVEACDIYSGTQDIIVCDGFTGNAVIKSSEGAMGFAYSALKARLNNSLINRLLGLWLRGELKSAMKILNPAECNGAIVAGSDMTILKSHGNAKERAFRKAIERAARFHDEQASARVLAQLDKLSLD